MCLLAMTTLRNYETMLAIALLSLLSYGVSQPIFVNKFCLSRDNSTVNSRYHTNLNLVLSNLTAQSSISRFYNYTSGVGLNKAFALYYCRGDVTSKQCNDCVNAAAEKILKVYPNQREAIVWYQECMLHYAKEFIFSAVEIEPLAALYSVANVSDPFPLGQLLNATMEGIITQAAHNRSSRGFALGRGVLTSFDSLYGLVQCTPDILGEPREVCLRIALGEVLVCCGVGRVMVMIFLPSCQLRYGLTPFYLINTTPPVTSLPPPSPAFVSNPTPPNKPTIYQIPLPISGQSGGTILTSGNNFKLQTTMALGLLLLFGNNW